MDCHFNDEYLDKLPPPSSLSTVASEGNLDDVHMLKQVNDSLKKELERKTEELLFVKKVANQQENKDQEIAVLREALEKMTQERDVLKLQLEEYVAAHVVHKPVANPLQTALVNVLIAKGAIQSKEVEEVMRSIDRGDFSPKEPYVDRPQQLGFNTTISAPHMHATQLELLKDCLSGAKKALDIGTGSGYVALSLAKMMRSRDIKVYGIDHIPKLVEQAKENVLKNHKEYIEDGRVEFVIGDGREGLSQYAPFDVIFVGGAVSTIPEALIDQLALGGSMIIPVGEFFQNLTIIHKNRSGKIEKNPAMSVMFGKLQSVEEQCPDIDDE